MQQYTFQKLTQIEILEGIKNNDADIIQGIYQDQYPKVEKFVLSNNGNSQEAKDIFQEAFVALWKNIKSDRFTPENSTAINGYLYQIAKNKWLDQLRSSKFRKTVPLESYHEGMDEEIEDRESKLNQIDSSFKNLGKNCKELLTRFYYKKESMSRIAKAFDWTEATARNNKYRCIQRLKEMLITKE
ncbi:RNA polymerase sigma factor, sigma-70 family [Aquiflexum balticum DSM 16537]|uniref:RNA polymerase sigma factor, sigma-70 family n=1 Tax=Aquiflexum balticum DSM 16537 TaxID=758820 RepID=A0A1W2H2Y5_9BACT|nr:sigma-70 family RNA polymerase sigma factor [Aquiflexum balticum]SMD42978.1 RNA polymerase sigma factor, sigma-70 family [Aquiflexum balticum DSM 16537]